MINGKPTQVEYMCSVCGHKEIRRVTQGRPLPGICSKSNRKGPHRWLVNKKF